MRKRLLMMAAGVLLAGGQGVQSQAVTAVPKLDQAQVTGTWYEIARLPNKREKGCLGDAKEQIALADKWNQMQMVDSCTKAPGYTDARNYTAKAGNKSGDGEIKVTTLWPFTRRYWVLAQGTSGEWLLIGNPNRKELWIYARERTLTPEVVAEVKAKAGAEGYATDKMVMSPQSRQ